MTTPSPLAQPAGDPFTLSGQVIEVIPGRRVPVPGISVLGVFLTARPGGFGAWAATYKSTTTGPDGHYQFSDLPAGSAIAIVRANSATHRQVCGSTGALGIATQLDVEITSKTNPQPSLTPPPLRVTGQIYEMTSTGRVGIDGVAIYTDWANDGPFLDFYADADGHYTACGIPADWPIGFEIYKTGYESAYVRRQFSIDSTLDIELKRP